MRIESMSYSQEMPQPVARGSNCETESRTGAYGEIGSARRFVMVQRLAGIVVALTVVIAAAVAAAQTPQSPDPQMPSVISLPPEFDRVLRDYEAAWREGDGPRLASLFTDDGFAVQSGSPIRRGRAAIAGGLTKPGGTLQLTAYAYSSSATVAYIVGGYRYPSTVGTGGRFVLALRSGPDGRWLIAADLDNSGPSPPR
jgi:ketosteroid isomerase-like protein